jgi:hypothetical protein
MLLHSKTEPRRHDATMGEALEQPPLAKNKNLPMANNTQPNPNMGKLKEERFHRPHKMSPM